MYHSQTHIYQGRAGWCHSFWELSYWGTGRRWKRPHKRYGFRFLPRRHYTQRVGIHEVEDEYQKPNHKSQLQEKKRRRYNLYIHQEYSCPCFCSKQEYSWIQLRKDELLFFSCFSQCLEMKSVISLRNNSNLYNFFSRTFSFFVCFRELDQRFSCWSRLWSWIKSIAELLNWK